MMVLHLCDFRESLPEVAMTGCETGGPIGPTSRNIERNTRLGRY